MSGLNALCENCGALAAGPEDVLFFGFHSIRVKVKCPVCGVEFEVIYAVQDKTQFVRDANFKHHEMCECSVCKEIVLPVELYHDGPDDDVPSVVVSDNLLEPLDLSKVQVIPSQTDVPKEDKSDAEAVRMNEIHDQLESLVRELKELVDSTTMKTSNAYKWEVNMSYKFWVDDDFDVPDSGFGVVSY